ncbi:MAG: hypothetical protein LUH05_02335 [Candidatus Gastranaerophilales bacterium]|nr:hypothetical protein [Candidatus Gastranaerophilales bacterium]
MTGAVSFSSNPFQMQKKAFIKQRYDEIYTHEQAHKNAAGAYGGSIVIEKDNNGIPTGGHVDIEMPVLNTLNPDETVKHADTVIKAAMAPNDPSKQDYKVAAEAKSIKSNALQCRDEPKCGQKLDITV